MHWIEPNITRTLYSQTAVFLRRSFFFSLFSSTLLYFFIRLFFYEFPFTVREGFELDGKIMLVIWIFLAACKLAFAGITLLENHVGGMRRRKAVQSIL